MRLVGYYNSGTDADAVLRLDRNQEFTLRLPQSPNVKWLTGDVCNMSGTGRVRVRIYSTNREAKEVILDPYDKIHMQNQPCDFMILVGIANAGALVKYNLSVSETESADELTAMVSNGMFSVERQDIANFLAQRVINTLYRRTGPGGVAIPVPPGRQMVVRDIRVVAIPSNFNQTNVPDEGSIRISVDFGTTVAFGTPFASMVVSKDSYRDERIGDWAGPVRFESDITPTQLHINTEYWTIPNNIIINHDIEVSYGLV